MLKKIILTTLFLFAISSVFCCTMLAFIKHTDADHAEPEDLIDLFDRMVQLANNNPHGWGISYFTDSMHTEEGFIWIFDPEVHSADSPNEGPGDLGYVYNRFADWRSLVSVVGHANYIQARDVVLDSDPEIAIVHLRNATTGSSAIPNPHPFVINTDSRSYTFSHHGTLMILLFNDIINYLDALYIENMVDSQLYFSFLYHMIQNNEGNVLFGLNEALHFMSNRISGKSFLFSDGEDIYAYRNTTFQMMHIHKLFYSTDFADGYTVIKTNPSTLSGTWSELEINDLAVLSRDGTVTVYPNFDSELFSDDEESIFHQKKSGLRNEFLQDKVTVERVVQKRDYVQFSIKTDSNVYLRAEIYNVKGQKITELHRGYMSRSEKKIMWNYHNQHGQRCSNGMYFLYIRAGKEEIIRKLPIIF